MAEILKGTNKMKKKLTISDLIPPLDVSAYFSALGKKGGKKTGESKKRGNRAYYQMLAKKGNKKRNER